MGCRVHRGGLGGRAGRRARGCRWSGPCGPRRRWAGRGGVPCGRPRAARRRPAGWSPRGSGGGRCRAGRARLPRYAPRGRPRSSRRAYGPSRLPLRLRLAFRDGSIHNMNNSSGVGVLDKTVSVLSALENGPASLAQLVKATGLARPTAHRIAVALETHRMLARDTQGRFVLGPRIGELAAAAGEDRLLAIAQPILVQLRDATG